MIFSQLTEQWQSDSGITEFFARIAEDQAGGAGAAIVFACPAAAAGSPRHPALAGRPPSPGPAACTGHSPGSWPEGFLLGCVPCWQGRGN